MIWAPTDDVDLIFRAFSDRTRLRILSLLQASYDPKQAGPSEICVCDLMRVLDLPQAKVSRHLAYLRKAGLVEGRKIQRWMYYRLLPAENNIHKLMLQCLQACPDQIKILKQDAKRLTHCCTTPGPCC